MPLSADKIVVNNRVLAICNGKPLSVIDVMKKMDIIYYQRGQSSLQSIVSRFEFYKGTWKDMLFDMIDRELVLLDAEEKKLEVSSGDVREELEEIFGPDVMINLDNAGVTYDEAWKIIKTDITIRRMLHYQVRGRIYQQITAEQVRNYYDAFVESRKNEKECTWRAVSIKAVDKEMAVKLAGIAHELLVQEKVPLDKLSDAMQQHEAWQNNVSVSVTPSFTQKREELTDALQALFSSLQENSYSQPLVQVSRQDQAPVVRIYYLQEYKAEVLPTLQEIGSDLRESMANEMIEAKTEEYFQTLRQRYHVSKEHIDQELPSQFQPFEMR